jgi:hypothetical protein
MDFMTLLVRDSAMIISNTEHVLGKPCLTHDDFSANLDSLDYEWVITDNKYFRLKRIFYKDIDDVIYITSVFFEYTDNTGEIEVEYVKED